MVDSCCRNIATNFKFAGRGQQETWVGDLRTTLLVVLRLRSRVQQVLEDFSAVSQTVRICKFSGERQRNTPVADLRTTLLEKPPAAPPARHRSLQPAKSAPRSGFPGKKFQSSRGGRTAARFFLIMAARPQLPGIEARPRHLPGIEAAPSR